MRIMVTGAGGMLGQDVVRAGTLAGHDVRPFARAELDIADRAAVTAAVERERPGVLVNCAAWTDVDGAEAHPDEASTVNGAGAGNVARACSAAGVWVLHVSSDYVFDGRKRTPYLESDPPAPLSRYGASKLEGEVAVMEAAPGGHSIVRSSWLFGEGGSCFPKTILRLAEELDELTVVDDQVGCPTFTGHLAAALIELAESPPPGIVHVAGGGQCSWFELAGEIVACAGLRCEVTPGSTAELGRPAPRPAYSVLGTERPGAAPALPHWREGLRAFLKAGVPS